MKTLALSLLAVLFTSAPALAGQTYTFNCALKSDASTYVVVQVAKADFDDLLRDVVAEVKVFQRGNLIASGSTAVLGERLLFPNGKFAFSLSLGRSGSLALGYDVVNESDIMLVNVMGLQISSFKEGQANCSFYDGLVLN
jgi:hypothetical protein